MAKSAYASLLGAGRDLPRSRRIDRGGEMKNAGRQIAPARRATRLLALLVSAAAVAAVVVAALAPASGASPSTSKRSTTASGFNGVGNILVTDQFNNRVLEINPHTNKIVWKFGSGSDVAGPTSVVAPNDAVRIPGGKTLIVGTGAPKGTPGYPAGGAQDNRVFIVNQAGKIVWQYGEAGKAGSGPGLLNTPAAAVRLKNGDILITDQGNQRVIEVTPAMKIVWQYGKTGVSGSGFNRLNTPNSAEVLANGHILIADEAGNRVIEVNRATKKVVWQYGEPSKPSIINQAAFASRLPNSDTLITDVGNNRILEVNRAKTVVWSYETNRQPGSVKKPNPTGAVRLANGDTLIANQFNDQVIIVTKGKKVVYQYGKIGVSGKGAGELNAPYSAVLIGGSVGLTPP
jgi:hypothetical protein